MDQSAVNHNVTIDDFDSLFAYTDQSVWTTPDPSASGFDPNGSPWLRGTFHETKTEGAEVSLNITGPALYVYGNTGPAYGSYEVQIDSHTTLQYSAYRESVDNAPKLLFAASNLTYANHNIVLRNLGAKAEAGDKGGDAFVLDFVLATVQLAPAGATVSNTTYEETDPAINFSGEWGHNTGPQFSGGGTTYTNEDQASFTVSFRGSAVYVLGDKKNDHRIYSIVLDGGPAEHYSGISGCGGAFGLTCEQQFPTIKYFASNLDDSQHILTLTNFAGVNQSFFDLDSIVVTVPSQYAPRELTVGANSPFVPTGSNSTSALSGTPTTTSLGNGATNQTGASPASLLMMSNPVLLLVFAILFLLRPSLRR